MNNTAEGKEIVVSGRFLKIAKLRHEWCDFVKNPHNTVREIKENLPKVDVFTFLREVHDGAPVLPFHKETASAAVLAIKTYDEWWNTLNFKVRNKIRKAEKSGVELRQVELSDDFVKGVEVIYNESPIRQGRPFFHYGKQFLEIKEELGSFIDKAHFVGAFHENELIGFAKLFQGDRILRTIHIIAKLSHRDKPVMDALIAKAVEICHRNQLNSLQYGSWTGGGVGSFRAKHGFERIDVPRYYVPLTIRGRWSIRLGLHHRLRDRLPEKWRERIVELRKKWKASAKVKPESTA